MEFRIWWEGNQPKPWAYEITYLGQTTLGYTTSLADCWKAADQFIMKRSVERGYITQDNSPNYRKGMN